MADRIRGFPWDATPLGPLSGWSARLKTAVDLMLAMPAPATLLWGANAVHIYNDAYIAIARRQHPKLLGHPAREHQSEADDDVIAPLLAAARAGRPSRLEGFRVEHQDSDGTPRTRLFDTHWSAVFDDDGTAEGVLQTLIEVTDWREAEIALSASEERLRQFGEASRDVLWIRAADTLQWQYLTPAFETIYGIRRAEALAGDNLRSWLQLVIPEDRKVAIDAIRRVRCGEHLAFEYRIRRPVDGQIRWLRDTDFPIFAADGTVAMIGGIGEDVTEQKLAQAALERSEERLRSAVEVGRLGLWDWNVATGEIHWSSEHFRMEGYAVGEVRPTYERWRDRLHPEDRAAAEKALHEAMSEHHEYVHEFRVVHPDGAVRWLSGRGRFFYDADGQPLRMIGAMVDVTERRAWEARQAVLIAELQHRTRNLMGVVRSMADKTARGSGDLADFRVRFRHRLEALSRVQGLLSRLNDHDRVTFDDLIQTELSAMDGTADRVFIDGPIGVRLRSSTVQTLAMALHELATNAIKYGALGQSGGRLEVRWRVADPEGDDRPWLHIDWRERGVAMPPADAPPRGTGAGRELIEQALPYQLNAQTTFALEADGVHCTIAIPISRSTADD